MNFTITSIGLIIDERTLRTVGAVDDDGRVVHFSGKLGELCELLELQPVMPGTRVVVL